jgi:hypothetical protein
MLNVPAVIALVLPPENAALVTLEAVARFFVDNVVTAYRTVAGGSA